MPLSEQTETYSILGVWITAALEKKYWSMLSLPPHGSTSQNWNKFGNVEDFLYLLHFLQNDEQQNTSYKLEALIPAKYNMPTVPRKICPACEIQPNLKNTGMSNLQFNSTWLPNECALVGTWTPFQVNQTSFKASSRRAFTSSEVILRQQVQHLPVVPLPTSTSWFTGRARLPIHAPAQDLLGRGKVTRAFHPRSAAL